MKSARFVLVVLTIAACSSPPKRNLPSPDLALRGEIPGIPGARFWGDEQTPFYNEWVALPDEELETNYASLMDTEHHYITISGGGARGAFGAGLLVGLSEAEARPEYVLVTGISAGSLIAPFAYLGSQYDHVPKNRVHRSLDQGRPEEAGQAGRAYQGRGGR